MQIKAQPQKIKTKKCRVKKKYRSGQKSHRHMKSTNL